MILQSIYERLLTNATIEASRPAKDFLHSLTPETLDLIKIVAQILISVALTISGLFVILSKRYAPKDKHWAYGIIGVIVGFWLK